MRPRICLQFQALQRVAEKDQRVELAVRKPPITLVSERQQASKPLHYTIIMSDKVREFIEIPQQFVRDGNQVCYSLPHPIPSNRLIPVPHTLHEA